MIIINYTYQILSNGEPLTEECSESAIVLPTSLLGFDSCIEIIVNNPLAEHLAFIGVKIDQLATKWEVFPNVTFGATVDTHTHMFFPFELVNGNNTIEIHFGD